ncbi:beta-L-arabinofuranosidase domain-containing protein [Echinicola salinicaeni]|uniref:beta-L-arabinofuranosidase domain-containing protein n=1 Tax=Echinicola salinicaeni TaxID=2762757 RepID=UPI001646AF83|nr:beta-L-arabinofuranosidase domain-containing protein [Echinicola salinicaeni]
MKFNKVLILQLFLLLTLTIDTKAQSGDQILDGIGETDLIARYILNGNLQDWSRNNLHGQFMGSNETYVQDKKFKNVISLPENSKGFIILPKEALNGLESFSISGWIYLHSNKPDQVFFDFGNQNNGNLAVVSVETKNGICFRAQIKNEIEKEFTVHSSDLRPNNWNHLAIILDLPSKTLSIYLNGKLSDQINTASLEIHNLINPSTGQKKLYIGRSISDTANFLNAKLYDFRIYRVPLSDGQIASIYRNSRNQDNSSQVNERIQPNDNFPNFADNHPQLYNEFLTGVKDIIVETEVGYLPQLPRYIEGTYRNGLNGPKVRVIWPAPKNNDQVLQAGNYTITGRVSGTDLQPKALIKTTNDRSNSTPKRNIEPFKLKEVSLDPNSNGLRSKLMENRDKFISTLTKTNPDDFLYMFRNAFGQVQPDGAKALGVWDTQETKLRGHATGHYLTAIAQAYASTSYDPALQETFKEKMEYMVNSLHKLSKMSGRPKNSNGAFVANPTAIPFGPGKSSYDSDLSEKGIRTDYWNWGEGYISAYPPDQFIMLEQGATYGGQENQVWAPYYTLHKILAGLMDIYEVSGNEKALDIASGMGTWVYRRLSQLSTDTLIHMWNSYIAGEFGGMNEAMARLYRLTDEPHYLEAAALFDNIKVFYGDANHSHGLAKNVDTFRGLHANQHIPQIMGALEMYRDTGSPKYFDIANNFWYMTTNDYMYSIGGVAGARNPANAECFISEPATLYENGFSAGGQNETCATYNMLKLSRNLFFFVQDPAFMDYYERGLYNHILASVAENTPANTYHVPLRPGSHKHFSNPDMKGFTCCNGTAIESSTKLQNSIYFKSKDNNSLFVNLFIPSTLNWEERDIQIVQSTSFPKEDHTQLKVKGNGGKFEFKLRVPQWATKGFYVKVNGKEQHIDPKPGTYATISRKWKDGDIIDIKIPFQFRIESVMDQQNIASLFYGPILLAAQENEPRNDWRKISLNANDIGSSIKGDPKTLEFTIDDVSFKPFYNTYGRHSVYLDISLK